MCAEKITKKGSFHAVEKKNQRRISDFFRRNLFYSKNYS